MFSGLLKLPDLSTRYTELKVDVVGLVNGLNSKAIFIIPANTFLAEPCYTFTDSQGIANDLWFGLSLGKLQIGRLKTPILSGYRRWKQIVAADGTVWVIV